MKTISFFLVFLAISAFSVFSQNIGIQVAILDQPFSDFTLTTHEGKQLSIHDLKGKNILIIVPRGKYQDDKWCTICNYQYAEYADIELNNHVREKYNLEIIYLFPYGKEGYTEWLRIFPDEMKKVEQWKYPSDTTNFTQKQKDWMTFSRSQFPKTFDFTNKEIPLVLPILLDENQEVSKGLDLSRTEWNGSKTLQNIPAIFIIDKDGILRFKYISQNTIDRPTPEYIFTVLEQMVIK